jgi:hypothetical protein
LSGATDGKIGAQNPFFEKTFSFNFFFKFGQNKFKGCKAPPYFLQKRLRFYQVIFLGVLAGCFWGRLTPAYYFFLINFLKIIYI